ncbi:uncharacterized protein LOC131666178 [Phymastichus coffea]|uniref:uncharacterized protein LOC131666178 n=1 Tax=Phymastichus coffea TaxID=108790 RepID=UPI00273CAD12|nr:uncharacterized protein LOC131666178 [Phymastichus coffea]
MFLILRFFNSILFIFAHLSIALYTLQRFFRVMRSHYQLIDEVEEYNSLVEQSRSSLDYVGMKVMEAMREIEADIGKEVYVTHNLTKLSSSISETSKRFHELEEEVIELARLDYNMENATVETPPDINEEVRRILSGCKPQSQRSSPIEHQQPSQRPRSARISSSKSPVESSLSLYSKGNRRNQSPVIVPEVTLLVEQRHSPVIDKPIGFRPPWMCPT